MKYVFLIVMCLIGYPTLAQTNRSATTDSVNISSFTLSMLSMKTGASNFSITKDSIFLAQQPYGKPQEKFTVVKFATPKKEWDDLVSQFDYSSFIKIKGGKSRLPEGFSDFVLGVKTNRQDHSFILDMANAQEMESMKSWVAYFAEFARKYILKYGLKSDFKNTF